MSIYIDNLLEYRSDGSDHVSRETGIHLKILPGTLELVSALDLLKEYCENVDGHLFQTEKENISFQERVLKAFENAILCDPTNLATLICRARLCTEVLLNPHTALQDLNALDRLSGFNRDIWVIASEKYVQGLSNESIQVNGAPYAAFKTYISEGDLYCLRSEMHGLLGHKEAQIRDLQSAAFINHEKA